MLICACILTIVPANDVGDGTHPSRTPKQQPGKTTGSRSAEWFLALSSPLSACPGNHRLNVRDRQCRQPIRHEPNHVRAKTPALILQAKRKGMIAGCSVATVIAVCAAHRHKFRKSIADDSPCVCHLLLRGFPILVSHCDKPCECGRTTHLSVLCCAFATAFRPRMSSASFHPFAESSALKRLCISITYLALCAISYPRPHNKLRRLKSSHDPG